jgi:nucleoside-diphosphate-sugar epimerase
MSRTPIGTAKACAFAHLRLMMDGMGHGSDEFNERLTRPTPSEIETLRRNPGDIVVLGASGKMGPSLIGRLHRASAPSTKIYAVARFTAPQSLAEVRAAGAEPIPCDLHNPGEVAKLPLAPNVFYLAGRKFGSSGRADLTWAANAIVPSLTGWHYRKSKIVAFSSGNVYPFVDADSKGCNEQDQVDPKGEYAQSALARERIFEYFSREHQTRTTILRLNYAVDLRYGTLVDIARRVYDCQPIALAVPKVNAIWQGDANRYAIESLNLCDSPAKTLNVTGPEIVDVAQTAQWFADRFNKPIEFEGTPGARALLNDPSECMRRFGPPGVDLATLREWVAQWIESNGELLDKPTNFETIDGKF